MATLEVHDEAGRVQFVEMARDHPCLFGTSAACDVRLEGEGIRPVHGRIRWKKQRFKVEASPDAEYVLVNGHKMTTTSLHQGDEIVVGGCRLYLIRTDDDPGPAPRSGAAPEDARTRMLSPSEGRGKKGHSRRRATAQAEPPILERDDWLEALQTKPRGRKASDSAGAPLSRSWSRDRLAAEPESRALPAVKPAKLRVFEWLRRTGQQAAPGRERIATSPLVIGLVASLALLVGMGFWLKSIITATIAARTFNRAVQNFEDGDYRTAMRDFDAFIASNPKDDRLGKASVLRAFANVRQYVSLDGATWSSALEAAQEMFDKVGQVAEFRDERVDLAETIIKIGEGLADRARRSTDPKALAEAERTVSLHAQVAGEPAPAFLNRSRLPAKLAEARAAVRKDQVRAGALAAMDQALADGSSTRVYDARDALVAAYADLAHDKDLIKRMTDANELIRKAVTVDPGRRAAERAPRPDPLGPPFSVVLRSRRDALSDAAGSIVFALADGYAYALDGRNGAPLWHVPVGLASPFVPQAIPGEATALAFDARSNELVRVDALTGALKWRLALGEPVVDPPLVLGNQLAQVLPGGKLLLIGLASGELETTVNLGRPLARSPVNDESGQHLYILGRQDCLFVLARDPLACTGVVYLGHVDGSIGCAPARLGRFLIVAENDSLYDSRLHVLVLDEDGAKVRPAQAVEVAGWTWQTPASSGSIVWGIGDKGGYEAFSVGDYASKAPFRSVAKLTADAKSSGPAFPLARSDRELWVSSGHSGRFELDPERGTIEPRAPIAQPGPAVAPIQVAGNLLVMTFQDRETDGIALVAIDPETGAIAWKTVVGSPWTTPPEPQEGAAGLSFITRNGVEAHLSEDQIAHGGFLTQAMPRPGEFALPAGLRLRLQAGGKSISAIVPAQRSNFLWVQDPAKPGSWLRTGLPATVAADPLAWGGGVLVPGADARAYLVDPVSARPRAEPFVPKFDRDLQGTWRGPAVLDQEAIVLADDAGRVYRVGLKANPVPRLLEEAQATLRERITAGPVATGGAVVVVTAGRRVRALASRDLSPAGSWELDAPLSRPLFAHGGTCFAMDRTGGVLACGSDGKRIWSINLGSEVVGSPLLRDQSIWFLTKGGALEIRARSDGSQRDHMALGILPTAGLVGTGHRVFVADAAGTIRTFTAGPAAVSSR
jgi:outer membrane protein assembly factor BamB